MTLLKRQGKEAKNSMLGATDRPTLRAIAVKWDYSWKDVTSGGRLLESSTWTSPSALSESHLGQLFFLTKVREAVTLTSNATAATVAAPSGSHMFQNAAEFDVVSGQIVVGDVHNHHSGVSVQHSRGSPSARNNSLPSLNSLDEIFSPSEIYCSQLLRQKRGFPLYVPDPHINLPAAYRRCGIAIGDVGRVTPEGMFDFFFNIFLPPEDPINENDTPEDFFPMTSYNLKDVFHHNYGPGDHVSTPTVQKLDLDASSDVFPGGHFFFSCDGRQGAVLALPDGAHLQKLENVENMRTYAAKHADSWYKYINGARGRGLANGELYLVTGCEKARSWGIASYGSAREEFELFFRPSAMPGTAYNAYRWSGAHGQRNPARKKSHDPPFTDDPENQATFIHGWSISLPTGLWGRLFGTVKTSSIVDFQSRLNSPGGSSTAGSQGSLFSWYWNLFGGGGDTGGRKHAGEGQEVVLAEFSPTARIFNPARLINEYILRVAPQATGVVMSHDDDWCHIFGDNTVRTLSEFLGRINDQFTIAEEHGATFLISKSGNSQNSSADNLPALATLRISVTSLPETSFDHEILTVNSETDRTSPSLMPSFSPEAPRQNLSVQNRSSSIQAIMPAPRLPTSRPSLPTGRPFFNRCEDFEVSGGGFYNVSGNMNVSGNNNSYATDGSRNWARGGARGGARGRWNTPRSSTAEHYSQFQGPPNAQFPGPSNPQGPHTYYQPPPPHVERAYSQPVPVNPHRSFFNAPNSGGGPRQPAFHEPRALSEHGLAAQIERRRNRVPAAPPLQSAYYAPVNPRQPVSRVMTMPPLQTPNNSSRQRSQYADDGMLSSSPIQTNAPAWPAASSSSWSPPPDAPPPQLPPVASTSSHYGPPAPISSRAKQKRRQTEESSSDSDDTDTPRRVSRRSSHRH
ncbi:hypothetical protein B0H19DRAFT_1366784 [Mycena capillaripes]|nr:hypothetical protein B0H19DRAFT_1366784 [Mycena capillaripes]